MKIAIFSFFGHMECLGFLLESLKTHSITIFLQKNSDKHNWLDYLRGIYTFQTTYIQNAIGFNMSDYDKTIKLTSNEPSVEHPDVLSLLHLKCLMNTSKQYITLTPYVHGENIQYTFPIFNPIRAKQMTNTVALIGYFLNDHADADTDTFISNNPEYNFVFILWGDRNYNKLRKHSNVTVKHCIDTSEMIDIINCSKYILSKKYINYDRFSGQLGLAMSFEVPLIIDAKTAAAYALPGFIFNTNYSEIGQLCNITDDAYTATIERIKKFNANTIVHNRSILHKLLE